MTLPAPTLDELRQAAEKVARDYGAFLLAAPVPGGHEDAKAFAAHHAACRAALGHLEALLKLIRTASGAAPEGEADHPDVASLLLAARAGIAATEDPSHDDED